MKKKRGLSKVVTNLLIIVLILVAMGAIWSVVNNFIKQGTDEFSTSRFTLDIQIVSASLDYETSMSSVRVLRDIGDGNLVGIKFIFKDNRVSEVFEKRFVTFNELEEKTFDINVTENSDLSLLFISELSIAPIILLETGEEVIGKISDSFYGLNSGGSSSSGGNPPGTGGCTQASDCGTDYIIAYICEGLEVHAYWRVYSCYLELCSDTTNNTYVETCPDSCNAGSCEEFNVSCNSSDDCGQDGFIDSPMCSMDNSSIVQFYEDHECVLGFCNLTTSLVILENCSEGEECYDAFGGPECFTPVDCSSNSDCDPGEICDSGTCVVETPLLESGIVYSIWPSGVGEYFDSDYLEDPGNISYVGSYVSFLTGTQSACLEITEHHLPPIPGGYAYVRVNETVTNISVDDVFQIWETSNGCI